MLRVLQPALLAGIAVRNRFIRSATYDRMADAIGHVTDRSVSLYEALAAGGVGLIVTGFAFVSEDGRAGPEQYGAHRDEMIPGLRRLARVAHAHGAKIALQIVHAGSRRYAGEGGPVFVPPEAEGRAPDHTMTDEELEGALDAFAAATRRGREAGFDAVQLHGAHGYLFSQLLSPLTNCRQDRWGGSAENRRRFHVEAVRRIRIAVGRDFPLLMKFGIMDEDERGTPFDEGLAALAAMREAGLDGVEISGGISTNGLHGTRAFPAGVLEQPLYRERAARTKRAAEMPVAVVGGIRAPQTAEEILVSGDADFVAMSRPFIREPALVARWQAGDLRPATCISCSKCVALAIAGKPLECIENRRSCRAPVDEHPPTMVSARGEDSV